MYFRVLLICKFLFVFITFSSSTWSEPFVVLEYRGSEESYSDSNNPFLNDKDFSTKHKVKKNETLTDIILQYYGYKNFNRDILSISIVHFNKHAFVRKNPNFLFANKTLYLPSLNEIRNLVLKLPKKTSTGDNSLSRGSQIYFFGG